MYTMEQRIQAFEVLWIPLRRRLSPGHLRDDPEGNSYRELLATPIPHPGQLWRHPGTFIEMD